jgi:hypothetical protein
VSYVGNRPPCGNKKFTENFKQFHREGLRTESFADDMVRFYWPGDKSWGWLGVFAYPLEIGPAKKSARVLAKFLRTLPSPVDLYLIAHSLVLRPLSN